MLEGTRKLFPKEYEKFKEAMLQAAAEDELPVQLKLYDIKDFTLKDVQDMFSDFRRDTGLEMKGLLDLSLEGEKLALLVEVSLPEVMPEGLPLQ